MSNVVPYPGDFPLESIQRCVAIIRAKTWFEDRRDLAFHLWQVQGFAQHALLGDPVTETSVFMDIAEERIALTDLAAELRDLPIPEGLVTDGVVDASRMDMATILAIAKMVYEILKLLGVI